jgi:hypothetical protein
VHGIASRSGVDLLEFLEHASKIRRGDANARVGNLKSNPRLPTLWCADE